MMRTANPALNKSTFTKLGYAAQTQQMTLQGTVNKTLIMLALLLMHLSIKEAVGENIVEKGNASGDGIGLCRSRRCGRDRWRGSLINGSSSSARNRTS